MNVREYKQSITLSSVGAADDYTTALNGLLYSVRVKALFAGASAVASNIKTFRDESSGSSDLALFKVKGPSSLWHEYNPRNDVMNTSGGSSGLRACWPIDGRIRTVISTSSALADEVLMVVYSIV